MTVVEVDIQGAAVAKEIHALRLASYAIESQLIDYPALPALHESVSDVHQLGERFLVCLDANKAGKSIVGALSFTTNAALLDICSLTVHPDHFGKGIASQLLREVEFFCGEAQRIIVSTAQKNEPAVRLYAKHGYVVCDQPVLADGLALVKMEKRLG